MTPRQTLTRKDFEMPDERRGKLGTYLMSAAEHAGKCAAALDLAIEMSQSDPALVIMVPIFAQLRIQAGQLEKTLSERATS